MKTIETIITNIEKVINLLVPLVFAIAFIVFLWGIFQFFFAKAGDAEARQKGRQFVMWGIIAFAIMISVWGLTNLVVSSLGLESNSRPDLPCFSSGDCSNGASTGTTINATPADFKAIDSSNDGLGPNY